MDDRAIRVTRLLEAISGGDVGARERLFELLYEDLHGVAKRQLGEGDAHTTLQPTALVNEAYVRLLGGAPPDWVNRRHFFFVAARAMRDILVEDARRKSALRRGGGRQRVPLEDIQHGIASAADEVLAVDDALSRIEALDPEMAEVVRLRFFGGLSVEEVARTLEVSTRSVNRLWNRARARMILLMGHSEGS